MHIFCAAFKEYICVHITKLSFPFLVHQLYIFNDVILWNFYHPDYKYNYIMCVIEGRISGHGKVGCRKGKWRWAHHAALALWLCAFQHQQTSWIQFVVFPFHCTGICPSHRMMAARVIHNRTVNEHGAEEDPNIKVDLFLEFLNKDVKND